MKTHTIIILHIIFLKLIFSQSTYAQCIYPQHGSNCITSNGETYTFGINLDLTQYENINWEVKGGIEITGSNMESVTIRSKTTLENNQKFSKGRIYCYATQKINIPNDTQPVCSYERQILISQYDVYKAFDMNETLNKISGASNIKAGDTCTYSIKPMFKDISNIGSDNYYWEFSSGFSTASLYTSEDNSAITFKVNNLTGEDTIKVKAGQCNTDNPDNLLTYILNSQEEAPSNFCSAEIIPNPVPAYGSNVFYTLTGASIVTIKIYDNSTYIRTIFGATMMYQGRQAFYFYPTGLTSGKTYKCVVDIDGEECVIEFAVE
jgi:hypothetical protein